MSALRNEACVQGSVKKDPANHPRELSGDRGLLRPSPGGDGGEDVHHRCSCSRTWILIMMIIIMIMIMIIWP